MFTAPRLKLPLSYVAAAVLLAPGVILVQLLIQNLIAVLWPSWVLIGAHQARGIDVMGQRMIMMLGMLVVLVVAVLPAAIAGVAVGFALYWSTQTIHILLPSIVAAIVLLAETWIGSEAVGKFLERTDVGQIDATES